MPPTIQKLLVWLVLACFAIVFSLLQVQWKTNLQYADAWGYYVYLPAIFIHQDLASLDSTIAMRRKYSPGSLGAAPDHPFGLVELHRTATGNVSIKYTSGVAILQAPFFLLGHLGAKILGYPADGFSEPYSFALLLSAIFYPLLGLFLLEKTLRKIFTKRTVWLTAAVLFLGTNLFYFSTLNFMSHAYLFALFCLLIFASDEWHAVGGRSLRLTILMGLSAGLISIIRPNLVLCLAIPAFWGAANWKEVRERFALFWRQRGKIMLAGLVFLAACLPQLIYWRWISGEWLHDSYPGESFNFADSRIWDGFFNYRNGWLVWTPVMFLALGGMFLLPRFSKKPLLPIALFLPLHVVIIYAWWAWWYPNGFGSRPMVETYPLLAFPLSAVFEWLGRVRRLAWLSWSAAVFFICLNVFQTWQWAQGIFWTQEMNAAGYWTIFGKTNCTKEFLAALDSKTSPPPFLVKFDSLVFQQNFETPTDSNFTHDWAQEGEWGYRLQGERSPGLQAKANELGIRTGDWLRLSVKVWIPPTHLVCDPAEASFLILELKGKKRRNKFIRLQNKVGKAQNWFHCGDVGRWDEAFFFVKVPADFPADGQVKFYAGKKAGVPKMVLLDEMKMERWR